MFRRRADQALAPLLAAMAASAALILLLVLGFLARESWPLLVNGGWWRFFADTTWHPLESRFGLTPMLWATLAAAFGALLVAVPIGLASALFCCFMAPPVVAKMYRVMLGLLAGIPSVVYGLWGLTVVVPFIAHWHAPGTSLLAAILILALMIVPTIAVISHSALKAVPLSLFQASAALGMSQQSTLLWVIIPSAHAGILGSILLACARALGETMAVLMVAGNVVQNPSGVFMPVRVLTANIALEMSYATGLHRNGLFASGLLLSILALILAWLAAWVAQRGHDAAPSH